TAIDRYGFESAPSSPAVAAVGDVEPPGAPLALSATVQGSDVVLSWSPPLPAADDLSEYYVYRETPSGWILVGVVSPLVPSYNDRNLANNSYRYRVTARDFKGNESAFSNEASATVQVELPASPSMLSVSAPASGSILDLSWQPSAGSGQYSYNVYRSLNESGTFIRVNTSTVTGTKFHDNGLDNGISYYYRVKALDSIGNEGEASNTASGVPRDTVTVQPMILKPTVPGTAFVTREYGLTIGGFAEPAALVDVLGDDALIGSATASTVERQTDVAMAMDTYAVSLSPDGKLLASNINSQDLTLLDMSNNITTNVSSGLSYIWGDLQWSPSGRYLLITGYDHDLQPRITLYDRESGSMRIAATGDTLNEFSPSWSSRSDNYVFAGANPNGQTSMWIASPGDGSVIRIADVNFADLPRLSPDGTRVAYFDNGVLFVFDRTSSTTTLIDDNNDQWSSSWSPDGSGIAFVSYRDGDGDIYSYNVADGSVERRTTSKQGGYRVVWSPDGLHLGYVTYSGNDELFMVVDANGGERSIFNASGEIYGIPEWRTNGELIIFDQLGLHTVQPPGYFSAQIDRLIPGENHLVAVSTDTYGNRSTPSDSITVVLDTGIMPDLVVAESDISFFPPFPKPGEEVLLTARVRNTSNNPAGNVAIDLYLWDGSGDVALIKSESIPGILANGDGAVSARFIAGSTIGTSTIIAVVDPANQIQEMVETNNHAAKDLIVTDQELVSISSSTSSSQFGANQEASFEVTLMNSGLPTSGTLKVMVEDSNGNLVQLITSQPQDLPYALNQKLAFTWNTGATYAGFYRLHVLVTDEIGTVTLAESATPFSILPDIKASGSITTDKQSYGPGETVVVNVSFNNSGVNHFIPQLKARLQIVDSGNTQLFNEEKSFASLLPSMGGSFSAVWNTGSLPAGTYAAVMDLSAEDQLLDTKTTVFNILPQPLLKGALTTDTATVLTGRSFTAGYTLSNHGNSTATGIVRITLQDPDGQTIVTSTEQPVAIQVNGSMPGSVTFDTTGLTPRTYQVVLTFKSDATWQNIAMATIAVKDGLPPTISIVSPLEAASYSTDVSLSVFASDDFSGVDKVECSIDNGAWKALPLADASKGRYTSFWTPALADNGSHSVSFRGVDRAGNSSIPVSVNFHVQIDITAPVLIVSTLANESYTKSEVLNISGTVTDNVAVKELLINGTPVHFNPDGTFSHALILADGSNTIEVTATDMASNPVSDTRTIHLDQKAPLIDVTSPADNSKTGKPEIFVRGNVDETSTVEVLLNGVTQPSERQGDAFEANLTPVYGSNTIEVVAVDLAANKGTEKRTVTFDDQKPSLAITEPGQDIRTNRDVLILKGTVADTLTPVSVSIEMDGVIYTPALMDGGFEQRHVMTEEKSHVIKVTATDEVGNSISVLRNVIYDITPPALTIDPVESPTIDGSQIINGTREPDSAVVVTSSTAAVGDVTYPTDTTWQVSLTLMPGSNIVTASSTDGANNVATISKEIVYTVSTSNNIFSAAIFGNSGVTMTGNSYTDSYINSPSSWIRGKYKNGDVASNSLQPCGIKMSGGTQVFGKLWVGQDGNPAIVGCTNGGATVSGGSGALAVAKDMTPKADPAGGISIGAIKLSGHGSKTLAAGDYRVSTININGNSTLYLSGPLTLHVDGNFSLSGNSSIVITSGEVTIYQNGRKLQISCGSIVNTNKTPASLVIYGTAGLQTVDISGNTDLHALVYAPTAVIRLSGGQNTFGSIIGSSVDISGGSSVHYDEGLKE
ncbi:MAG: CARDB domain-containing protein, partial [Deltaproteobacteria bacterium]|nr:CARDB domain-containing protein [Deltaproteobacteria bacterium]